MSEFFKKGGLARNKELFFLQAQFNDDGNNAWSSITPSELHNKALLKVTEKSL